MHRRATCGGSPRNVSAKKASSRSIRHGSRRFPPRLADITLTETLLRRGKISNETTTYHYDVILHVSPAPAVRKLPPATPWQTLNLEQLEAILMDRPAALYLTGIPDSRLAVPLEFRNILEHTRQDAPVPDPPPAPANALSAEDLFALGEQTGYRVHVRWQDDGTNGLIDAVFFAAPESALPAWPSRGIPKAARALANQPVAGKSQSPEYGTELRRHLADRLPDYMIPWTFVVLENFPLTPNGKIDRKALPAPDPGKTTPATPAEVIAPRNPSEAKLLEIWMEVLAKKRIGVHDDIFALGGDSILIFQISTRARRAGLSITPAMVFRHRTVSALIAGSSHTESTPHAPAIQRVNRDEYRRKL